MMVDMIPDERAQLREKRIRMIILMMLGDSLGVVGILFGYAGFLDWLIATPLIVLGFGISGFMLWQMIDKTGLTSE